MTEQHDTLSSNHFTRAQADILLALLTGGQYRLDASGDGVTAQPRIFTEAADPGSRAGEGDLWIVAAAGVKQRVSGAWVAV